MATEGPTDVFALKENTLTERLLSPDDDAVHEATPKCHATEAQTDVFALKDTLTERLLSPDDDAIHVGSPRYSDYE